MNNKVLLVATLAFLIFYSYSCKHKPQYTITPEDTASLGNFPTAVGKIIVTKCATAGCHNSLSYENAAGLRLDKWEHLFDGSVSGSVVVPYSVENSSLLFFINHDSSLGPMAEPRMPLNADPLTTEEYKTMRDWVASGAPDKNGNIPFADNADKRQKIYITQQGCDLLGVVDAEKKVVMRYIKIGEEGRPSVPHRVQVAPDGKYAYVSFINSPFIQKINTSIDKVEKQLDAGNGQWNILQLSPDSKRMLLTDLVYGRVLLIDAEEMKLVRDFSSPDILTPHGVASNVSFDTFYITSQLGNTVYKLSAKGWLKEVSLDDNLPNRLPRTRDPHEIIMAPDYSKYFVTCQSSNEVRVLDAHTDKILAAIPVGIYPQEVAISKTKPYLFVTCSEDNSSNAGFKGSVYVINYETLQLVQRIDGPFYQPHGVAIDDQNGIVYIANRNVDFDGPAPHHSSSCGGRNGYYTLYDLNTLQRLPKRYEVSVDPYSADARFK